MSSELHLPLNLPFPIKIVSLDARPPANILRGARLLSYSFAHVAGPPDVPPETRYGTWDSPVDGTLDVWKLKVGEVITSQRARDKSAVVITEPCTHEAQIGGLCAFCGKDMTLVDYTGFSDSQRATIAMTHAANGPLVSLKEAQRLERETAEYLLKTRRLSLIVDLDQTIVHATVDPTVGEWIAEGEAWEVRAARRLRRAEKKKAREMEDEGEDNSSSESSSDEDSDDEVNPNWEALKDVAKFRLAPESFTPHIRGPPKGKGKARVEDEGCLYYIKPRPGWKEFLSHMATKYEMHVYTMGTRAYAEEVCTAIDPDKKIFGGRILSRDESGSLTQKSLQRLFPCDTSMVVIIDDRADVWEWSPNLVKVIPYDFFVGIGDINSTFLPKLNGLASLPGPKPSGPQSQPSSNSPSPSNSSSHSLPPPSPNEIVLDEAPPPVDEATKQAEQDALLTQNTLVLEAQLEERPLAKMQEELSERGSVNGDSESIPSNNAANGEGPTLDANQPLQGSGDAPKEKQAKKALLTNNDTELTRVQAILDLVHQTFFDGYDAYKDRLSGSRRKSVTMQHDVRQIIPRIRMDTLRGVHIVFSSVIPLDMRPESTEIWKTACAFGADCATELTSRTTHVVAAKRGTAKVDAARRRGGIKIVWLSWFTDSIALWRHQDERPYLLDEPPAIAAGPSSSPTNESSQMGSSDLDLDTDEWEEDDAEHDGASASGNTGATPNASETSTPVKPEILTNEVPWEDIDAEVEAAMNESDTEDGGSERGEEGMRSVNASDDEGTDGSATSEQSSTKRKRLRSLTPSEAGSVTNGVRDDDSLRSPLAKRKRMAAERTGASKLKQSMSVGDLGRSPTPTSVQHIGSPRTSQPNDENNDGDDEDDGEDELEDFLAHEMAADWS